MLVSRLAGLVLPASSKWLIDEVVGKQRTDLLLPIALAAGVATLVQADHVVRALADSRRGCAARHHRHAQARSGAGHAPAGPLLRFDADRRARLAHHERRRRASGTSSAPASCSWSAGFVTAVHGPRRPLLAQLAADRRSRWSCWASSAAAWPTRSARLRPLFRERGKINAEVTRPSDRGARRHPHRQVVHGGEARGDRLHQGRPSAVPQHRQVDDRCLGHHRGQHGRSSASSAC